MANRILFHQAPSWLMRLDSDYRLLTSLIEPSRSAMPRKEGWGSRIRKGGTRSRLSDPRHAEDGGIEPLSMKSTDSESRA